MFRRRGKGGALEPDRRRGERGRGASGTDFRAQRGDSADRREPRHRHRATEAADGARALTGARYGIVTTVDETGEARDFVSSGFTEEEHRRFLDWPDRPKLFAHLRDLPGPARLTDLPALVRSLGFSPDPMPAKTFQGTPMRHRGETVGHFFLVGKEGAPEFTDEDEEVLALFAGQAAAAIANARSHRDERRARADLEALVETSPVGVVVFDARTGDPLSFNREARRIVEGLRIPGRPIEELLRILSTNAGRVVTYDALVRQIWNDRAAGDANLVRNFIKKLRAKIGEDAANPTWIFNVRGVGYRMPRPGTR